MSQKEQKSFDERIKQYDQQADMPMSTSNIQSSDRFFLSTKQQQSHSNSFYVPGRPIQAFGQNQRKFSIEPGAPRIDVSLDEMQNTAFQQTLKVAMDSY